MILPLVALLALAAVPPPPDGWQAVAPLLFENDGDYGPGGEGPSWRLQIDASGRATLYSSRWRCSSGLYEGQVESADQSLLLARIQDLRASRELPACCGGLHTPGFLVASLHVEFTTGTCISLIQRSPLSDIYREIIEVILRTSWATYKPIFDRPLESVVDTRRVP